MLRDFDIKPILTTAKNPQSNAPAKQVHQVILNMIVTKYLDNKVFYHIYPRGETLAYIEWSIWASYYRNITATPVKYVFGRDMLFNLTSVLD